MDHAKVALLIVLSVLVQEVHNVCNVVQDTFMMELVVQLAIQGVNFVKDLLKLNVYVVVQMKS